MALVCYGCGEIFPELALSAFEQDPFCPECDSEDVTDLDLDGDNE